MKVHYPKLYNMAHISLNVFTASKGSNNYILFTKRRYGCHSTSSYLGYDFNILFYYCYIDINSER